MSATPAEEWIGKNRATQQGGAWHLGFAIGGGFQLKTGHDQLCDRDLICITR
jgi:hypothetical protein